MGCKEGAFACSISMVSLQGWGAKRGHLHALLAWFHSRDGVQRGGICTLTPWKLKERGNRLKMLKKKKKKG